MVNEILPAAELYTKTKERLYIELVDGTKFFVDDPHFDIGVIAHALANQCRYTGHCSKFYSVAEHSVLVADIMKLMSLGDPFEGLMHDATEAYIADIAAPWKVLLPDYKVLEGRIEGPLRTHFGLPPKLSDGGKRADWIALAVEALSLIPSGASDWTMPEGVRADAKHVARLLKIHAYAPVGAHALFMERYHQLDAARQSAE